MTDGCMVNGKGSVAVFQGLQVLVLMMKVVANVVHCGR